ncbi:alpha/beta fold hydrolase [Niastella populi]|uniref:alpha/beta fold hydrolase n=1 Tax=Niastella populi TaxID=550983 RepID=UPI0009BFD9E4|nr:alpha/beta hydrolase [Niastella populi]
MRKKVIHWLPFMLGVSQCLQVEATPVLQSDTNPITEQTITLANGVQLNYAEKGNAENKPVIFIHGYSDSWRSFEKVLPLLPADVHAMAITLRGHGNSSKPAAGYSFKTFAADIAAFITAKKLGPCILAGHSMGGLIVQQFAIDYPQLTRSIIIVSSDASFADNPGVPEFLSEVMKLKDPVDYSFAEAFQKSTLARPVDSAYINQCIAESMKLPARVWHGCAAAFMKTDLTKELPRIAIPALILWGSKDGFCSRADQQNLAKRIKNARLVMYEEAGHALHWEESERFAKDVVEFINASK